MGLSEELRRRAVQIWEAEREHPFILGIGDGTLPLDRFRYYMRQDYLFLIEYCRSLALAVAKAGRLDDMGWFARLLRETLNTEMALHRGFAQEFGISTQELESAAPSPTTHAYTRHLLRTAYSGNLGQITASLLPCQWGYCELGQHLVSQGMPTEQPLYVKWIEAYNSPEFAELAQWLRDLLDRLGQEASVGEKHRIEETFLTSSRYEYLFWDAAYRMEEWPV